ncbi:uncharacterized protein EDB91DRAFT_1258518 [Suillus paluster]|uniref:uncharacterized protein n=1 Tax=Suillus paluster TaxID=48578 RepID=UPI001B864A21|nr:uncharacterized protein EDB91DRAFT_1258518 [Suillus paluster]KAG1718511.1 hypothetical protein EDB91DRAFT_1258518 [Suillus paluster]
MSAQLQRSFSTLSLAGFHSISRNPGLLSFSILVALYIITEMVFSVAFFWGFSGWRPAFPLSWRFLLLLLFVVPIFAFIQVSRFLLPLLINRWNGTVGGMNLSQQGYVMLQRNGTTDAPTELFDAAEEENALLENVEEGSERSRPVSPTAHLVVPHPKWWWIQLLAYIVLFCVSTWVGLHYEQPGDVRYRDSIQSAVDHPRRQGYGKQGALVRLG